MAHAGDNIRSLLDRLEVINTQLSSKTLNESVTVNEISKGSALRSAPSAATSARPKFRTAVQSGSTATAATDAETTTPTATSAGAAATPGAQQDATGAAPPAGTGATDNDNAQYQANIQRNQQLAKELQSYVTSSQGRVTQPGGLWTDPAAFKTAWEGYMNKHGGQAYRLLGDEEMLSAMKQIWMRTGGTQLKESVQRFNYVMEALLEEREQLLEERIRRQPLWEDAYNGARMLAEADITQPQIQELFKAIEAGAQQGMNKASADAKNVSNRTFIGKTGDVVGKGAEKLRAAWDKIKTAIALSGPVSGFDNLVDKLQTDIKNATGGQQGALYQALQKYKDFGEKHPVMQGAVYAIITAAAATALGATGPVGLGLLAGGLRTADRLLQGDRASSALWRGFKAGAIAAGGAALAQYFSSSGASGGTGETGGAGGTQTSTDGVSTDLPSTPSGGGVDDALQGQAATSSATPTTGGATGTPTGPTSVTGTDVDVSGYPMSGDPYRMDTGAAGQIGKPPVPMDDVPVRPVPRPPVELPAPSGAEATPMTVSDVKASDWYDQLSKEAKKWLGSADRKDPFILDRLIKAVPDAANVVPPDLYNQAAMNAARAASTAAGGPNLEEGLNPWIDWKRTNRINQLRESRGVGPTRNVYLKEHARQHMFRMLLSEGIWDSIKSAAKAAWKTTSNKITFEKLDVWWRRNYGDNPAYAESVPIYVVVDFLRKMGVTDYLIQLTLKEMGLPFEDQAAQDDQQDGQDEQQDGQDDQQQQQQQPPATITDGPNLLASFKQYSDTGKSVSPYVRGQIGAVLKTALNTVQEDIEQLKLHRLVRKIV